MNQQAIEAAAEVAYARLFCQQDTSDIEAILEAALPHLEAELRAKIAAEINAVQAQKVRENPFNPFATDPIATGYIAGLGDAARIVEGKQ